MATCMRATSFLSLTVLFNSRIWRTAFSAIPAYTSDFTSSFESLMFVASENHTGADARTLTIESCQNAAITGRVLTSACQYAYFKGFDARPLHCVQTLRALDVYSFGQVLYEMATGMQLATATITGIPSGVPAGASYLMCMPSARGDRCMRVARYMKHGGGQHRREPLGVCESCSQAPLHRCRRHH